MNFFLFIFIKKKKKGKKEKKNIYLLKFRLYDQWLI